MTDSPVPHAGTREDRVQQIADVITDAVQDAMEAATPRWCGCGALGQGGQDAARAVLGLIEADYVPKQDLTASSRMYWETKAVALEVELLKLTRGVVEAADDVESGGVQEFAPAEVAERLRDLTRKGDQ